MLIRRDAVLFGSFELTARVEPVIKHATPGSSSSRTETSLSNISRSQVLPLRTRAVKMALPLASSYTYNS